MRAILPFLVWAGRMGYGRGCGIRDRAQNEGEQKAILGNLDHGRGGRERVSEGIMVNEDRKLSL